MLKPSTLAALALTLAASLLLAGCGEKEVQGTRLQFTPRVFTVGAGLNQAFSHSFQLQRLPTEQDRFERETGKPWGEWKRVVPERASLTVNEAGLNWGFAYEVIVKAYTDDIREAREIFYRDQIRDNVGPRLDLIPSEIDLKELFGGPEINLIVEFRTIKSSPAQSIPATLTWSFSGQE